jgi:hypothetical protein
MRNENIGPLKCLCINIHKILLLFVVARTWDKNKYAFVGEWSNYARSMDPLNEMLISNTDTLCMCVYVYAHTYIYVCVYMKYTA